MILFILGKVDMPQSEIMTKYLDTPKTSHSISSPKRTSPSPSSHNYDKKSITETKGKQNKVKLEHSLFLIVKNILECIFTF